MTCMIDRHILVVDDSPNAASRLAKMVKYADGSLNCRVSIVRSGEEAMKVFNGCHVDLLITDQRVTGVTGLEPIRWVRALSARTPTIVITGSGRYDVRAEARSLRAGYVAKRRAPAQFIETVHGALHSSAEKAVVGR